MVLKRSKRFDTKKFENLILHIAKKCAGNPRFGEAVFYKMLYFADFDFYELYERSLTGETYLKRKYGPVPKHFQKIAERMIKEKKLERVPTRYFNKTQKRYIPLVKPDYTKISGEEIVFIDKTIDRLNSFNATQVEDYSHEDIPFKTAKEDKPLDYEMVFYRAPQYSVREYSNE